MTTQYQSIPIIQATTAATVDNNKEPTTTIVTKGEVQPPAFRDAFFGVLFYLQLLVVVVCTILYATGAIEVSFDDYNTSHSRLLKSSKHDTNNNNNTGLYAALAIGGLSAIVIAPTLTVAMFSFMGNHAQQLIQDSIYVAIGINIVLAILLLFSGAIWVALGPALTAVFTYMYARYIWHRIPLAAANLKTAISSLQSQLGVAFLGIMSIPFYVIWWALWIYFFVFTLNTDFMKSQVTSTKIVHTSSFGDDNFVNTLDETYTGLWWSLLFLMLVSFYWTNQVIGNTVQTTVAGTVGTFWFVPSEAVANGGCGCCSPALSSSLYRSLTFSFGSICMGSLIVAIIQALRQLARQAEESARNNREGAGVFLLCLVQCLLSMLESIAEYFNKWAFLYVGLYGYSYLEAGKNVISLLKERGWTAIITDDLTGRVLGMLSFAIGLATGVISALVAILVSFLSSSSATSGGDGTTFWGLVGGVFLIGFLLGLMLSSMVLAVVTSAADTIVILFAEAPFEFQQNHPSLAIEMNQAWSSAYPDMFTATANPTMNV